VRIFEAAPVRGTGAKSYEGLYDSKGNYKHRDCSRFELEVTDINYRITARYPDASDKELMRRYRKATGLKGKIVDEIETKAILQCGWVYPEDIWSDRTP
jgi:hypothetical protein